METISQNLEILKHLQNNGSITPIDALKQYGVFRLGARIYDLKRKGYNIATEIVYKGRKKYAKYVLMGGITQ